MKFSFFKVVQGGHLPLKSLNILDFFLEKIPEFFKCSWIIFCIGLKYVLCFRYYIVYCDFYISL